MHDRVSSIRRAAILVIVAATLGACATSTGGNDARRIGAGDWRLIELNARPAIPSETSHRPWMRFAVDSGRVMGSGGCNRMSGPFTLAGASLRFGAIVSTKMACADSALNGQEQGFFSALESADRFEIHGDTLVLLRGNDALARLVR